MTRADEGVRSEHGARRHAFFIAGVARSGSTALDLVLGNRADAFSLGEFFSWYRPTRSYHLDPRCACGKKIDQCEVWRAIGRPPAAHIHRRVLDVTGATMVVDSSKRLSWIRDAHRWTASDGIDPHILFVWRDPKQLAHSWWKRGSFGWASNLDGYMKRLADIGVRPTVVSFDDLVRDPVATLQRFYDTIGISAEPGQERFWDGHFHYLFGSATTRGHVGNEASALREDTLPEAFLEYWDSLPAAEHQRLAELSARVVSGEYFANVRPSRLPPRWYVQNRVTTFVQGIPVRWSARRGRSALATLPETAPPR